MLLSAPQLSSPHKSKDTKIQNIRVHVIHVNKNGLIDLYAQKAGAALALMKLNNKLRKTSEKI